MMPADFLTTTGLAKTGLATTGLATTGLSATGSTDFFGAAAKRLDYIDQRQRVLAQNIANADTPNYRPRDLSPFAALLQGGTMAPVRTSPLHLGLSATNAALVIQATPERAPDGNSVNVEGQLSKVADDETSASLVGNLWKTTMGMYLTALGRGG